MASLSCFFFFQSLSQFFFVLLSTLRSPFLLYLHLLLLSISVLLCIFYHFFIEVIISVSIFWSASIFLMTLAFSCFSAFLLPMSCGGCMQDYKWTVFPISVQHVNYSDTQCPVFIEQGARPWGKKNSKKRQESLSC